VRTSASGRYTSISEGALRKLLWLIVIIVGCATEPTSNGTASITGDVLRATGAPWAGVTVQIICSAGKDTTQAITDAAGGFGANLAYPTVIRGDQTTSTSCRFAAPSLAAPQAALTQTITLYPPRLQPEQHVTLHEGTT